MAIKDIIWEDGKKISKEDVFKVERTLNVKFPDDFIKVVLENDRATPNLTEIDFNNEDGKVFSGLLSLLEEDEYYIVNDFNDLKDRLPEKIIPFADDPFGNFYCFDYRKSDLAPTIVYWYHEYLELNEISANAKNSDVNIDGYEYHETVIIDGNNSERVAFEIVFVANSFTELLDKLYEFEDDT